MEGTNRNTSIIRKAQHSEENKLNAKNYECSAFWILVLRPVWCRYIKPVILWYFCPLVLWFFGDGVLFALIVFKMFFSLLLFSPLTVRDQEIHESIIMRNRRYSNLMLSGLRIIYFNLRWIFWIILLTLENLVFCCIKHFLDSKCIWNRAFTFLLNFFLPYESFHPEFRYLMVSS